MSEISDMSIDDCTHTAAFAALEGLPSADASSSCIVPRSCAAFSGGRMTVGRGYVPMVSPQRIT